MKIFHERVILRGLQKDVQLAQLACAITFDGASDRSFVSFPFAYK